MTKSKWWWVVAAYATVIFVVSVIPVTSPVATIPYLDKAAHVCEYLLFAWLLVHAIRSSQFHERDYLWWAWIYASSYGLLLEVIQAVVPWRSAEFGDALANGLGAAVGVWIGQQW